MPGQSVATAVAIAIDEGIRLQDAAYPQLRHSSPESCPDFGKAGLLCNETASRGHGICGAKRLSKRSIGVLMPDFGAREWPIAVRSKTGVGVRREFLIRLCPEQRDHVWSNDFVYHRAHDGRAFRMLNVLDEFTWERLAIRVQQQFSTNDVIERMTDLFLLRVIPAPVRSANGPEFRTRRTESAPWPLARGRKEG